MTVNAQNDELTIDVAVLEETMSIINAHPELHHQRAYTMGTFATDLAKGIENMEGLMWTWADKGHTVQMHKCGSAACFAGWVSNLRGSLLGWQPDDDPVCNGTYFRKGDLLIHAGDLAAQIIGLTEVQAETLFHAVNSRPMLEAMVKDLSNTGDLRPHLDYCTKELDYPFGDCLDV